MTLNRWLHMNIKKIFMHEFIMILFQLFQMVALRRIYFQKWFFSFNFFYFYQDWRVSSLSLSIESNILYSGVLTNIFGHVPMTSPRCFYKP